MILIVFLLVVLINNLIESDLVDVKSDCSSAEAHFFVVVLLRKKISFKYAEFLLLSIANSKSLPQKQQMALFNRLKGFSLRFTGQSQ